MHKNQPQGWVEVLFSLSKGTPSPASLSCIVEQDYMMLGSPLPIQEVDGPYDIYHMLHDASFPDMPRPVRSFDLINVIQRGLPSLTYVIVSPHKDKAFLAGLHTETKVKNKVIMWPQFPHGIMELPKAFSNFAGRTLS